MLSSPSSPYFPFTYWPEPWQVISFKSGTEKTNENYLSCEFFIRRKHLSAILQSLAKSEEQHSVNLALVDGTCWYQQKWILTIRIKMLDINGKTFRAGLQGLRKTWQKPTLPEVESATFSFLEFTLLCEKQSQYRWMAEIAHSVFWADLSIVCLKEYCLSMKYRLAFLWHRWEVSFWST